MDRDRDEEITQEQPLILCSCCPPGKREVLGKVDFDRRVIEIRTKRWGRVHTLTISLEDARQLLRGPLGNVIHDTTDGG